MKGRVVVAMSGGVDSSMAAALLAEQGYDVVGMTMRLSEGEEDAARDAKRVAEALGILHDTVDFREDFQKRVIDNFLAEYALGRTPNPCIVCNQHIKFGLFWQKARELGADFMATGHYARIVREGAQFLLKKGRDDGKDQSYVLCRLKREILPHILLPMGELRKSEVRGMAEQYGLPVAHKPESQEICFVPGDDYRAYLRARRPGCLCPGEIVDTKGRVLGHHEGVSLYTIGQRRGLGIAAECPLYVIGLDTEHARVIVGRDEEAYAAGLVVKDCNWLSEDGPGAPRDVVAKIRYGKRECRAVLSPLPEGRFRLDFFAPQRAVTPGQTAVFYEDDTVLGGGTIEKAIL